MLRYAISSPEFTGRVVQASLEWRLDADLKQYWNWNTKIIFAYVQAEYETKLNSVNQASLFDVIITKKSKATLKGKVKQKYDFMDQGKHMRGMPFNLTMTWCIMPRVGAPLVSSMLPTATCSPPWCKPVKRTGQLLLHHPAGSSAAIPSRL